MFSNFDRFLRKKILNGFYTEQRVELTQAFINAIEDTVYRIRESPTRYIAVDDEVRRCMTRRFPYGILYTIE